ncbi:Asp23/Gls24 family envelope stress response protein [Nocardia callitridis]|uniref:Asp23/Gls24 family envelope stress response protein n=1 Tax=Nocardia callitridis TaxID=648753 RepID=A0ABP9KJK2_9NOCA
MTTAGSMSEIVIGPAVVAAVAARAAATTPGVQRLEPGVRGLVSTLMRAGKQRVTNSESASSDGVRVRSTLAGVLSVQVDVVISGERRAAEIGAAVQREVVRAVREQTGEVVDEVSVSILDIEPESR